MRKLWKLLGTAIFFLGWPVWFVYFKIWHNRTRVLLTSGESVLLVKGWLGNNEWTLPGGGIKKSEKAIASACRELLEETGIDVAQKNLRHADTITVRRYMLSYEVTIFTADIKSCLAPKPSFPEILEAKWVNESEFSSYDLGPETSRIINSYLL